MSKYTTFAKILGYGLALFIILSIISCLASFFHFLTPSNSHTNATMEEIYHLDNLPQDKIKLDIDLKKVSLNIETGSVLSVSSNDSNVTAVFKNNTLVIKEKGSGNWFFGDDTGSVDVTLPSGLIFSEIDMDLGAGLFNIYNLEGDVLDLELGAGNVNFYNLKAYRNISIDAGVGKLDFHDCEFSNLDLDLGVGSVFVEGKLFGYSDISGGVGSLEVNVLGNREDYRLDLSKGIGEIVIDGDSISSTVLGNGRNSIKLEGGIGRIALNFQGN